MKVLEELNENNFLLFAAKNYENPRCLDIKEFHEDLLRFKYIKRLLKKYHHSKILKERLLLNHLIVLYNVFGIEAANQMIFYKMERELWPILKPFLIYLNYLPEKDKVEIPMDQTVISILRKI